MNTNNNAYTVIYASVVVIVVAFLLAFVSKVLEPQSKANERIDKKKQILASLNIRDLNNSEVESTYRKVIIADEIIKTDGSVVATGKQQDKDGFAVTMKEIAPNRLPVYVCKVKGDTKYVFPLIGKGLWGSIWGYISVNSDLKTVFGSYFSHESETAGLGARITEVGFQNEFVGKKIYKDGSTSVDLKVVKNGKVKDQMVECDGISGATLTSNGVNSMLQQCLGNYKTFLKLGK
jgi:Na+-transporting NADH:ubiquinone oxidoreductase subunit C